MVDTTTKIAIDRIIETAAEQHASDLHLMVGNPPTLRVEQKLIPLVGEPILTPELMQSIVDQMLTPEQQTTLQQQRELLTASTFPNSARFRVHFYYSKGYIAASLRLIPDRILTVQELGLPSLVERFAEVRRGLVLFVGPYGSGRSSTMAALVQRINQTRAERILTIEHPIEFLYVNEQSLINQQAVGQDIPDVATGLRSALDEDVNVIVLSELETPDLIRLALRAANSGRLVYAAMNSASTDKAIEKVIESFGPDEQDYGRSLLADTLSGVVLQRLLPRVGGGIAPVVEVLSTTPAVRSVIREGNLRQLVSVLQTSREEGMISLDLSLAQLIQSGEIQLVDALGVANDPEQLRSMVRIR